MRNVMNRLRALSLVAVLSAVWVGCARDRASDFAQASAPSQALLQTLRAQAVKPENLRASSDPAVWGAASQDFTTYLRGVLTSPGSGPRAAVSAKGGAPGARNVAAPVVLLASQDEVIATLDQVVNEIAYGKIAGVPVEVVTFYRRFLTVLPGACTFTGCSTCVDCCPLVVGKGYYWHDALTRWFFWQYGFIPGLNYPFFGTLIAYWYYGKHFPNRRCFDVVWLPLSRPDYPIDKVATNLDHPVLVPIVAAKAVSGAKQ